MARTKQTARASVGAGLNPLGQPTRTKQTAQHPSSSSEDEEDEEFTGTDNEELDEDAMLPGPDKHVSLAQGCIGPNDGALYVAVGTTIAADSGYQSGPRNDWDASGGNGVMDDDACSVATDGQNSNLPLEHKHVLEAQFARTILDRIKPTVRDRCSAHIGTLKSLLKTFSILIRGRATSRKERDAASFVRHRREYVQLSLMVTRVFTRSRLTLALSATYPNTLEWK